MVHGVPRYGRQTPTLFAKVLPLPKLGLEHATAAPNRLVLAAPVLRQGLVHKTPMVLKEILVMVLVGYAVLGGLTAAGIPPKIQFAVVLLLSSLVPVPEHAIKVEVLVTTMPIVHAPTLATETLLALKQLPVMISVAAGATRRGREMRVAFVSMFPLIATVLTNATATPVAPLALRVNPLNTKAVPLWALKHLTIPNVMLFVAPGQPVQLQHLIASGRIQVAIAAKVMETIMLR